ncbi:S1 RNA-binding domain-containing protein [Patescibacteria group bacterium]|nr:S1 RNA-binding domain-containing protein [Patescibacteria group bacterium]
MSAQTSTIKPEETSKMWKLLEEDHTFKKLPQEGDIVRGFVISGSKKEVLLDIDGVITGIVRGKELYNESEEFSNLEPGAEVEATVIELENEKGMMELSFRYAGHQKTWRVLQESKETNQTIMAKVMDANKGGLLITVNHVPGFLPVSQLSPEFYPRIQGGDKNKILERLKSYVGKSFPVKILDINEENEKLIVSEKAAWEEEQKEIFGKYKVGDIVEGKITAVTDFGTFVEFGENLEGLIHISELAWQRIDNPSDLFKVSQDIKAEIIKIDGSKIFLSSKKLHEDPWKNVHERYKIGDIVDGTVLKATPFGLFVELDQDIHGLAHISELSNKPIASIENIAKPGTVMKFKIVSIEPHEHRLGLSLKSLDKTEKTVEKEEETAVKVENAKETEPAKVKTEETKTEDTEAEETK